MHRLFSINTLLTAKIYSVLLALSFNTYDLKRYLSKKLPKVKISPVFQPVDSIKKTRYWLKIILQCIHAYFEVLLLVVSRVDNIPSTERVNKLQQALKVTCLVKKDLRCQ